MNELGQHARVVQMGMGEYHRIDTGGFELECFRADSIYRVATLMHAALEQDSAYRWGFKQVTGTCYLAGGAIKSQSCQVVPSL